jgi:acetoin utilization protein AcuB
VNGTVGSRMSREVMTVGPDDPLRSAVDLEMRMKIRHIPVVDDAGKLVGIVTDRDIKRALPSPLMRSAREDYDSLLDGTAIAQVMTREPLSIAPEASIKEAVKLMVEKKVGGLPVVTAGKLVGIFTQTDALKICLELLSGQG